MAITKIITAARKANTTLAAELKDCTTPTQREVLTYFRGYVPRPDSLGAKIGEPMPVPTTTEWAKGTGFGDILPTPYITPNYLAALLGRSPRGVLKAALYLIEAELLPSNLFPTGTHEYAPMVLDDTKTTAPNREPVTPGEGMDPERLEDACPYGGYAQARLADDGTPETLFHSQAHRHTSAALCPFAFNYTPSNPESTDGCTVNSVTFNEETGQTDLRTLRLNVPTPDGVRRHRVSHQQFHAYYRGVPENACPWHGGYMDHPAFPWSDLNPANRARLEAFKAGEAGTPDGGAPRPKLRFKDYVSAFFEGLSAAYDK